MLSIIVKKILAAAITLMMALTVCENISRESRVWEMDGVVTSSAGGYTEVMTADGNIWGYYDDVQIPEGCGVTLTFDDNGTDSIDDDIIIMCRYFPE